jgi:hypothetical protein
VLVLHGAGAPTPADADQRSRVRPMERMTAEDQLILWLNRASSCAGLDLRAPDDLPEMTIGVTEVAGVDPHGRLCGGSFTVAPARSA